MTRSYSSGVRPWASARASVTLGCAEVTPGSPRHLYRLALTFRERSPARILSVLEEGAVLDQAAEERVEDERPVRAAQRGLRRPLRMRHQAEHGTPLVHDPGDVQHRPVRIRF